MTKEQREEFLRAALDYFGDRCDRDGAVPILLIGSREVPGQGKQACLYTMGCSLLTAAEYLGDVLDMIEDGNVTRLAEERPQ